MRALARYRCAEGGRGYSPDPREPRPYRGGAGLLEWSRALALRNDCPRKGARPIRAERARGGL